MPMAATGKQHSSGLAQQDAHDVTALRAQGNANPKLTVALGHQITQQPVESSQRDQQRRAAEISSM